MSYAYRECPKCRQTKTMASRKIYENRGNQERGKAARLFILACIGFFPTLILAAILPILFIWFWIADCLAIAYSVVKWIVEFGVSTKREAGIEITCPNCGFVWEEDKLAF